MKLTLSHSIFNIFHAVSFSGRLFLTLPLSFIPLVFVCLLYSISKEESIFFCSFKSSTDTISSLVRNSFSLPPRSSKNFFFLCCISLGLNSVHRKFCLFSDNLIQNT